MNTAVTELHGISVKYCDQFCYELVITVCPVKFAYFALLPCYLPCFGCQCSLQGWSQRLLVLYAKRRCLQNSAPLSFKIAEEVRR